MALMVQRVGSLTETLNKNFPQLEVPFWGCQNVITYYVHIYIYVYMFESILGPPFF